MYGGFEMAKKHHHMTKYEYNVYKKNHRSYRHALDVEAEKVRENRSTYGKLRRKSDEHTKHQLRHVQGHSGDFLDEDGEDGEDYDLVQEKHSEVSNSTQPD